MFHKLSLQYIFWHIMIMALLWWMLVGQDLLSWSVGIPAILLSLLVKSMMPPIANWRINFLQIPPFVIYFLYQSLLSGCDVIRRVCLPECPLDPAVFKYYPKIKNSTSQVFFANAVSLLPGTCSVDFIENYIEIHVLDKNLDNKKSLNQLEVKIARLCCEEIMHD